MYSSVETEHLVITLILSGMNSYTPFIYMHTCTHMHINLWTMVCVGIYLAPTEMSGYLYPYKRLFQDGQWPCKHVQWILQ